MIAAGQARVRERSQKLFTWLASLPSGEWTGSASELSSASGQPVFGLARFLSDHADEIRAAGFVVGFSVSRPVTIRFTRVEE